MANVYKNIQATITSSASDDDMYTSPNATTSIVKTIKLYGNFLTMIKQCYVTSKEIICNTF